MTQQVNLYLPEFQKKKELLNFTFMAQVVGSIALVLFLVTAFKLVQIQFLKSEVNELNAQFQSINSEIKALTDRMAGNSVDRGLAANVENMELQLEEKSLLLQLIEDKDLGNSEGFSEHLADLARYHISGLQITQVELTQSGSAVSISGQVEQADIVPLYLQNLSRGEVYQGKSFDSLQISQEIEGMVSSDDSGNLFFSVSAIGE